MHAVSDGSHTTCGASSSLLMPPRCGAFQCKHRVLRGSSDIAAALVVVAENAARDGVALLVCFAFPFAFALAGKAHFAQRGRSGGAAGANKFFCTGCGFATQRARLLSVCVM